MPIEVTYAKRRTKETFIFRFTKSTFNAAMEYVRLRGFDKESSLNWWDISRIHSQMRKAMAAELRRVEELKAERCWGSV
jgi:hypothetical protein